MKKPLLAIAAAFALALPAMAVAQTFPTKTIRLIVTYPPGGGADLMARLVAPKMAAVLGQPNCCTFLGPGPPTLAAPEPSRWEREAGAERRAR